MPDKLNGSKAIQSDSFTSIGLGTPTPSANLHITGTIIDAPISTVTSSQTYAENAAGKVIVSDTSNAVTITFAAASASGFGVTVVRSNTGNVIIANSSAVTRQNTASITTMNVTQYGAATILYTATNKIVVFGDFS